MKISANSLRVGNVIEHEGHLWVVLKTMHTQPGKGGAYIQAELKDIKRKTKDNVRFRSSEDIEKAHLEPRKGTFLYLDTDGNIVVLDQESFEQYTVHKDLAEENCLPFLQDNMEVTLNFYNDELISIEFPDTVSATIQECEPVVKGQTATSSYKPAVLDNGVRIMVPPFIGRGDRVIVKIATSEYVERDKG